MHSLPNKILRVASLYWELSGIEKRVLGIRGLALKLKQVHPFLGTLVFPVGERNKPGVGWGLLKHLNSLKEEHLLKGIWLVLRWLSTNLSCDIGTYLRQNRVPCHTEAASAT